MPLDNKMIWYNTKNLHLQKESFWLHHESDHYPDYQLQTVQDLLIVLHLMFGKYNVLMRQPQR